MLTWKDVVVLLYVFWNIIYIIYNYIFFYIHFPSLWHLITMVWCFQWRLHSAYKASLHLISYLFILIYCCVRGLWNKIMDFWLWFSAKEKYHAWKVLELGMWIAEGMLLGGVKGHTPLFLSIDFFPHLVKTLSNSSIVFCYRDMLHWVQM